jgi:capsular polysaccharide transport system ATP-binding protein
MSAFFLEGIGKSYGSGQRRKQVLLDVNLMIDGTPPGLGVMGCKKSGKTTLLGIVAGTTMPDVGRVIRGGRVSWPLSWRGFGGAMTGHEQVTVLARLYRIDRCALLRYVAEVSHLAAKLHEPMTGYAAREKDRLLQAAALGIGFDLYLIDESIPGVEKEYSAHYQSLWRQTFTRSSALAVSSHPARITDWCDKAALLDCGSLSAPMPLAEASAVYKSILRDQTLSL